MKNTIIINSLLYLFYLSGYSQGIEFNTYESETVQKTSYNVFTDNPPLFHDYFSLTFDLAIHDPGSFGYIFRIKEQTKNEADIYSLVFSYDTHAYGNLKFNIEAKENLFIDTLDNSALKPHHWIPVTVKFYLKGDSASLSIQDRCFITHNLGLPISMRPDILFGSSTFSQEIPPFAVKNVRVEGKDKIYCFPLNESSGREVHDETGTVIGNTINPIWLINKSYHWHQAYSFSSQQIAGTGFDPVTNEMFIFNNDSLLKIDLSREKSDVYMMLQIPMKIRLGTSFFDLSKRRIYIYEVENPTNSTTIGALNVDSREFMPVSTSHLSTQRHHHACYVDVKNGKYYIFGGFGSRKYYNEFNVLDIEKGEWTDIPLTGDFISPRFFSSMGALNADKLLLFGGTGNTSGDQAVGKLHYYDLYTLDLKLGTVRKLWEFSHKGENFVPVRGLILSEDKKFFYTLCYPMHLASSYLQLYKFSIEDGSYTILGDSIPMESKAILSNANLYYNSQTNEYYCCVHEFQEYRGDPSVVKIYSLAAPAISANELHLYVSKNKINFLYPGILAVTAFIFLVVFGSKRRKNKKRESSTHKEREENPLQEKTLGDIRRNAIYIFGEFTVYNKKGKDVSYMFSNKTKHLFLLTLLKSLDESGGITSS